MRGFSNGGRPSFGKFDDNYDIWFDSRRRIQRTRQRSRTERGADILDTQDMVETLLVIHQSIFETNKDHRWTVYFPYLFVKPDAGDKVLNLTTNEVLTIEWVEELEPNEYRSFAGPIVRNNKPASFTGRVIFREGTTPPADDHSLEFINKKKNYINFFEWASRRHTSDPVGANADGLDAQSGPFKPSVTWHIKRVEPGSIGKHPFDPQKQLKPSVRETFPDPDRTYLSASQGERDVAQISTNYATGQPIITGAVSYSALQIGQNDPAFSTHSITVYGQWFDNIIQYDCWSVDNQEANALVTWFEDFMDLYTKVMKQNGVNEVLYWQRSQDGTIDRWRSDIDNRSIQYYFRTEKLRVERSKNLQQVNIRVQASLSGEVLLLGEPTGISYFTGRYGLDASQSRFDSASGITHTGSGEYRWGSTTYEQ